MLHLRPFVRHTVLALCLALPAACTADTTTTSSTTTKPATKPAATAPATRVLATAPYAVEFASTTMTLKGREFTIEVALSDDQHQRGLMYRDTLAASHGMLFVMPQLEPTKFWMKNTRIPLDIIFVDQKGKVVEIAAAKPFDETSVGPTVPVRYVIELNQGSSDKIGLKVGDTVEIPAKYVKN